MENAKWVPKGVIPIPACNSDTRPPDFAIFGWINNIVLLYRLCGVFNTGGGVSIQVTYFSS